MAAMLAKQSGASRTSPILRGNWLVEVLLGDKLPKPPKGVPPLPENEDEGTLSMRQITERHSADPKCSGCHARIDAYGFALENFDAIGRLRDIDPGGRPVVTAVTLPNGTAVDGARGLRDHLATARQEEFLRSFCRKFLGYALGRALKLSDQPLVTTMMQALHSNNYRFTAKAHSSSANADWKPPVKKKSDNKPPLHAQPTPSQPASQLAVTTTPPPP